MLQKNENQEKKSNTPLSNAVNSSKIIDLDDEIECTTEGEMNTINKVLDLPAKGFFLFDW